MTYSSRVPTLGLALGVAVFAHACAEPPEHGTSPAASDSSGQCQQQIIVTFASAAESSEVEALAASAGVGLNVISHPLPATYVLDLAATVHCDVALMRLRNAAGVRAAEPDVRRRLNQG
ncbi:MAG: hypothetical protein ABI640_21615 [Gammaproteobacteria bacterium]